MVSETSLRYQIARRIARLLGLDLGPLAQDQPPEKEDEPKGYTDANFVSAVVQSWEEVFLLGYSRQRRYGEYDLMDDAEVSAQLDAIVDSALISDDGVFQGFRLEAGTKYLNLLQELCERLDLGYQCRPILRDVLKNGDEFDENVVDENLNIVRIQSVPCSQMYVNVDDHNRLRRGWEDVPTATGTQHWPAAYHQKNISHQSVAAWLPWEMRHLKWHESTKHAYSVGSYLEPMRRSWHALRMVEQGMVVARIVRAYLRQIHYLDTTGKLTEDAEASLKAYVEQVTKRKLSGGSLIERPLEVDEDLFLGTGYIEDAEGAFHPKLTKIDTIDPRNTGLAEIEDIEYLRRKLFSRVSGELVGIERTRGDLSLQDVASSRLYQYCQRLLERQLLWPLFRLQLLLKGYRPLKEDVRIIWPEVVIRSSWRFSDAFFRKAMAWRNHVEMGTASRAYAAKNELGLSDAEWQAMRAEVEDEAGSMPAIPQGSQAAQTSQGNRSA